MEFKELIKLTIKMLEDYHDNAQGMDEAYSKMTSPMIVGVWKDYLEKLEEAEAEGEIPRD